jgi:hypothetical protein
MVQPVLTDQQISEIKSNIEEAFKDLNLSQMEQKSQMIAAKSMKYLRKGGKMKLGKNKLQVIHED